MTNREVLTPETWQKFHDDNFEDGPLVMSGYVQCLADIQYFAEKLMKEASTVEEFTTQLTALCKNAEAVRQDVYIKLRR